MWPKEKPKNILVRMPNWLGDAVMATPILADLRTHFQAAAITAMCQNNISPLIQHDPNINEVFSYSRPSGWIHRRQHLEIIEPLRKGEYDLGILLTNSFSSAWWFWRGGVKSRLGFAKNGRSFLLNKAVSFPENKEKEHLVVTYKALLQPLGIPLSTTSPRLYLTDKEIEDAKELLKKYRFAFRENILVGINPGAAYGSAKCWLPERFEAVTARLLENQKVAVLYFGDGAGAPLVNKICEKFEGRVLNLAGKTSIRQLMALISLCTVFLTNDSGPMHIASALGTPLLALFGSTSEIKTGPYKKGKVIHKHVECSPCYKRICPFSHFQCMKKIGTDEVYKELMDVLKESGKSP